MRRFMYFEENDDGTTTMSVGTNNIIDYQWVIDGSFEDFGSLIPEETHDALMQRVGEHMFEVPNDVSAV